MIKNIEDLKNIQIFCREEKDVKNCLNMLEKLGFKVFHGSNKCRIISYSLFLEVFKSYTAMDCGLENCFYNKKFIKTLQKLIKQKEEKEKKEKIEVKDFKVAEDGRIIKINNYESKEKVFIAREWDYREKTVFDTIEDFSPEFLDYLLKYGLAFSTQEARDKAVFKMEIETKLKNIAERLNKGQKIDWEDEDQKKFLIYYDYTNKRLGYDFYSYCKIQEVIHCLDINFLDVAKQEIGEENLIKYFTES